MKRLVFALLILFCGNDMSAQTYKGSLRKIPGGIKRAQS